MPIDETILQKNGILCLRSQFKSAILGERSNCWIFSLEKVKKKIIMDLEE